MFPVSGIRRGKDLTDAGEGVRVDIGISVSAMEMERENESFRKDWSAATSLEGREG